MFSYFAIVVIASVVSFLMYGWDKRQSKNEGWRIPEKRLHGIAMLGGWPGAMLGQSYFRHKTQKLSFKIFTWLSAAIHITAVAAYCYVRFWISGNV